MKEELDKALVRDFPLLYAQRNLPMTETCMCWGFEVSDNWEPLIRELSEKIEPILQELKDSNEETIPSASQVKEKFGTLRFYMDCYPNKEVSDKIEGFILEAERKSAETCEHCGAPGEVRSDHFWRLVLCDSCQEKRNKKDAGKTIPE